MLDDERDDLALVLLFAFFNDMLGHVIAKLILDK